jgi:RimJ/RimL family protein N-acetyltransferase
MLIPFKQFRADDLETLVPNAVDEETRNLDPKIWRSWGEYDEKISVGYTGCIDGKPVAAVGIRLIRPGIGTAWAYFTKEAAKHKLSVIKSMKLMLKYVLEACDFKRVRARVRVGNLMAERLVKHFGFKKVRRFRTHDYYILEV